jgi:(p)ppGpp synthase/HD superfamily hydrolase
MTKLDEAIKLASWYHKDQKYADEPYINHLLRVMEAVKNAGHSETAQIVAVLHDSFEDTNINHNEVLEIFGECIYDSILAMTHKKGQPYEEYILNKVLHNYYAKIVKFYDVLDNFKHSIKNEKYYRLITKYEKALQLLAFGEEVP